MKSQNAHLQELSDAFSSSELLVYASSVLIFVLLLCWLNPLTTTTQEELFSVSRFEKKIFPGLMKGALLGFCFVALLILGGSHRYLGFLIQWEESPYFLLNVLIRVFALGILIYCEEFIFRHKIFNFLRKSLGDFAAAGVTALLYGAVKALQFDLGVLHLLTLFLFSMSVAMRVSVGGEFSHGAGIFAGLLIVFHPLLSLPVFGNEIQGILLVRYQATQDLTRLVTGGAGGPLSSLVLQFLILIDFLIFNFRRKKISFKTLFKTLKWKLK